MTAPEIEPASYPVFTIADMARIPADALPRFLAELPALVEIARPVVTLLDMAKAAGAEVAPEIERASFAKVLWVDDDKGTATVNLKLERDGKTTLSSKTVFDISAFNERGQ